MPERHSKRHVHSLILPEHVLDDMRPHEAEYDHSGFAQRQPVRMADGVHAACGRHSTGVTGSRWRHERGSNLVAGVCSGLPLGIQDLMWGTDNERVRNRAGGS